LILIGSSFILAFVLLFSNPRAKDLAHPFPCFKPLQS
jgi:hypothetical protein